MTETKPYVCGEGAFEIRPCPFCGDVPDEIRDCDTDFVLRCGNRECPVDVEVWASSEAEAIAIWNARAERTCKVISSKLDGQQWTFCHEFSCDCGQRNYFTTYSAPPKFCPNCGAEVVG